MAECEVCGNDYDKAFTLRIEGLDHTFDCLECAIHAIAPVCVHCGCRVIGHGMESAGRVFCSAHCAEAWGVTSLKDRVEEEEGAAAQP